MKCRGLTESGEPCKRDVVGVSLCYQHARLGQTLRLKLLDELARLRSEMKWQTRKLEEHRRNCRIASERASEGMRGSQGRLILEPESGDPLRLLVGRHRLRWNGEKWIKVEDEATWTDREALVLGTVRIVGEDGSEVKL